MKKAILVIMACLSSTLLLSQTHWSPVSSSTSGSMVLIGKIQINGVDQTSDQLELGVFCGNECRGACIAHLFDYIQPAYYMVDPMVYGDAGNSYTFKLYDHAQNQELDLTSPEAITFTENGYGNVFTPYVLNFTGEIPSTSFHFTTAGNWSEGANWQGGALPGANDEVFIDANCLLNQNATVALLSITDGCVLTLQSGKTLAVTGALTNAVASGLVIQDGAQLVNTSADVNATVEKDIIAYGATNPDGWYTIASPVNGMAIAGSTFLTPEYDLFRYNETSIGEEWENYKYAGNVSFDTFENGRGYLYANSNNFSPTFVGALNNTAVTYGLTYTDRTDGLEGFNLIGNPFPHAIYKGAGGAIDNANLASGYYTLANDGAWQVHNYADAIMPGRGVLVKTTEAVDLNIAKNNTEASAEVSGTKGDAGYLSLCVTGNGHEDRAFVYFSQGIGLDKMNNLNNQIPSLWIRSNDRNYAIAHLDNNCESIDVIFSNRQSGDFCLSLKVKDAEFECLQLVDDVTGSVVDLLQQPEYTFHATGSEPEARFRLIFKMSTGIEEAAEEATFAFVSNGGLVINGTGTLQVIDVSGRVISSNSVSKHSTINGMKAGVYVLRLINNDNVKIQKIVIK